MFSLTIYRLAEYSSGKGAVLQVIVIVALAESSPSVTLLGSVDNSKPDEVEYVDLIIVEVSNRVVVVVP